MAKPSRIREVAHAALLETTPAATVGEHLAEGPRAEQQDGVELVDVVFATTQPAYRGWSWVVTVATVAGGEPTVLELGMLPGDDALLSPEWVPWSVRLAEWQAQQAAADADRAAGDEQDDGRAGDGDDGDESEDDEDDDFDDDDDGESDDDDLSDDPDAEPVGSMREGDIDGVDIDELAEDEDEDDSDEDSEDDDSDDEDSDEDDDAAEN